MLRSSPSAPVQGKDVLDESQKRGTGTSETLLGKGTLPLAKGETMSLLNVAASDFARPGSPGCRSSNTSMLDNLRNAKNETIITQKTKVSKIKPPERIAYEWEWDVVKFEKAFPMLNSDGFEAAKTRILRSDKVVAGSDIGRKSEWRFVLSEKNGWLSWFLLLSRILEGKGKGPIHAAFSLKIVDSKGKDILQKTRLFCDFAADKFQFGWNDICELQKVYEQKDTYLEDNVLRFRLLFEMFLNPSLRDLEALKQEKDQFARIVTDDLQRLRSTTGTADVHLDCEGKAFPVHKLVLAARSPYFAKLFEHSFSMKNSKQYSLPSGSTAGGDNDNPPESEQTVATVSIQDVEASILEVVLDYIYSGSVKPVVNQYVLSGLVRAADKFELQDLKTHCFNALMSFVTEENIGQLAVLAYRHDADRSVRININKFCIRHLTSLMRQKSFRDALKVEPDAFFPDDEYF